jgi:hypothetical protein
MESVSVKITVTIAGQTFEWVAHHVAESTDAAQVKIERFHGNPRELVSSVEVGVGAKIEQAITAQNVRAYAGRRVITACGDEGVIVGLSQLPDQEEESILLGVDFDEWPMRLNKEPTEYFTDKDGHRLASKFEFGWYVCPGMMTLLD